MGGSMISTQYYCWRKKADASALAPTPFLAYTPYQHASSYLSLFLLIYKVFKLFFVLSPILSYTIFDISRPCSATIGDQYLSLVFDG
jgi:hypothetical protein